MNSWFIMVERWSTIVCTFDPASPKTPAYEIHEWIHDTLRFPEKTVSMIQIDGIRRQVFIILINIECLRSILNETGGLAKYEHQNGELSNVAIAVAGLGTKRVRVANPPPEVNDAVLVTSLAPFGKVLRAKHPPSRL